LNLEARADDIRVDREVDDMRKTGRTEVDLAILTYDERRMTTTRPAGVRHPWTPFIRGRDVDRASREIGRFLTVRKAIDVCP